MTERAHGFAALNGGTTGGAGGSTVTVDTGRELMAAIKGAASRPLTIYVDGEITVANTGADVIALSDAHNISIIGTGEGAEFDGIGIQVTDESSNLIIQNLWIHDVASGPRDAIGIEEDSHNIWIDHNELSGSMAVDKDRYDGLLDIKRGAQYVTISNNHLHDHHKVSLLGYSDSDTGGRYVTYDHNVFENIGSRAPSVRDGYVHVYDNYYKDVETSAVNLRMGAEGLIENNVFEGVHNPIVSVDSEEIGYWNLRGNAFVDVSWSKVGKGEASASSGKSTSDYEVPYRYTLDAASAVKNHVLNHAGVGKLDVGEGDPGTPSDPGPGGDGHGTGSSDTLTGTAGGDTLDGLGGRDILLGLGGNDSLLGGTGDDSLSGGDGRDTLMGGSGKDRLAGGADADRLDGGEGKDVLDGGDGNDVLLGGNGNDSLSGGVGDDSLDGGGGKDVLIGGAGADTLVGGSDGDSLSGGDGNDRLIGSSGHDTLAGGAGSDVFVFAQAADAGTGGGRDLILDFGTGDRIDLSALDARPAVGGNQAFAFLGGGGFTGTAGQLRAVQDAGDTLIEVDLTGDGKADFQIELAGRHVLSASDFIL